MACIFPKGLLLQQVGYVSKSDACALDMVMRSQPSLASTGLRREHRVNAVVESCHEERALNI